MIRNLIVALIGVCAGVLGGVLGGTRAIRTVEEPLLTMLEPAPAQPPRVAVLDIDDATLEAHGGLPPRAVIARALDAVSLCRPAAVLVDLDFTQPEVPVFDAMQPREVQSAVSRAMEDLSGELENLRETGERVRGLSARALGNLLERTRGEDPSTEDRRLLSDLRDLAELGLVRTRNRGEFARKKAERALREGIDEARESPDARLERTLARSGRVVLTYAPAFSAQAGKSLMPPGVEPAGVEFPRARRRVSDVALPVFRRSSHRLGFVEWRNDSDGVLRRWRVLARVGDARYSNAVLETARLAGNADLAWRDGKLALERHALPGDRPKNIAIPVDSAGWVEVPFGRLENRPIPRVPFRQIEDGVPTKRARRLFVGAVVVVGRTDESGAEFRVTPLDVRMPTPVLLARCIDGVFLGEGLRPLSGDFSWALLSAFGGVLALALFRARLLVPTATAAALLAAGGVWAAAWWGALRFPAVGFAVVLVVLAVARGVFPFLRAPGAIRNPAASSANRESP